MMMKLKEIYSCNTLLEAILKYIENQFGLKVNEINIDKVFNLIYQYHILNLGFDSQVPNIIDKQIGNFLFNNESYFFRNIDQLKILKEYCSFKSGCKILSFGCAKGEEPYTVALYFDSINLEAEIVGIDIDEKAITEAKKGEYSDYTLRNLPEDYKKYFQKKANGKYEIDEKIKSKVKFYCINILKENIEDYVKRESVDIVLINNVLIYFTKKMIENVISTLFQILKKGGLVLTTYEEQGIKTFKKYFAEDRFNSYIYFIKPDFSKIAHLEFKELFENSYKDENTLNYEDIEIDSADISLEDALFYYRKFDYATAIGIAFHLFKKDPLNEDVILLLSESCYKLGFVSEAKKWLKTYLIVSSPDEEKIEEYLKLCLQTEDYLEYIRILKKKISVTKKKEDIERLNIFLEKTGLIK